MSEIKVKITRGSKENQGAMMLSDSCTIESEGLGPFSAYFPPGTSVEEMSQALKHQAVFLVDDLSRMIPAPKREGIIRLYELAAERVSKERG